MFRGPFRGRTCLHFALLFACEARKVKEFNSNFGKRYENHSIIYFIFANSLVLGAFLRRREPNISLRSLRSVPPGRCINRTRSERVIISNMLRRQNEFCISAFRCENEKREATSCDFAFRSLWSMWRIFVLKTWLFPLNAGRRRKTLKHSAVLTLWGW